MLAFFFATSKLNSEHTIFAYSNSKRVSVDPRKSILTQRNVNHQRLSSQRILQRTISENNNGRPDRPHVHFEGISTDPIVAPRAQDQRND